MKKSERENWQQDMFSLIRKWQNSEINQKDFCNQHEITLHAFYYWLRKYKQAHARSENGFVLVEIEPLGNYYSNGVLIILDKAVSLSRIKALIILICYKFK
jgi:hypothetical protein